MATLLSSHRKHLDDLTAIATGEVNGAVLLYKDQPLNEFAGNMRNATRSIANTLSPVASLLAVDYYDATRTQAKLDTSYLATKVEYDYLTQLEQTSGYAISRSAVGAPLESVAGIFAGAVQLAINNVDRFTISDNVSFDPGATRWVRVPTAGGCAFCLSMAAMPELNTKPEYKTWHDNCRCVSKPLFGNESAPELPIYKDIRQAYKDAYSELKVNRELANYYQIPVGKRPKDLALNTKNILKIVRETTGLR